jgi:6-phosphogluconolactonase
MHFGHAGLVRNLLVAAIAMTGTAASAGTYVYVGSPGTNEVVVLSLDPKNGDLTVIEKVTAPGLAKTGGSLPLAVSPNKKFLYAHFRGDVLAVATFAIDPKSGKLKHLGSGLLTDPMPFITTDRSGKFLLSASYSGNKVTVNPIGADSIVQPATQTVSTAPKAHSILIDKSNRHVLAPSLGGDIVNQFKFDPATGTLSPNDPPSTKVNANAGPRHFRFSGNEKFVYVLNELDATVYVFAYDAKAGTLTKQVQIVSVMPPGVQAKAWAAELQLTLDGKYLYASERTTSTLSGFKVDSASGMLTPIGTVATEEVPRFFAIDPSGRYLYAVGEKSDGMTSYSIDSASGKLTKLKQYPMGKNPNWVEIVNLP